MRAYQNSYSIGLACRKRKQQINGHTAATPGVINGGYDPNPLIHRGSWLACGAVSVAGFIELACQIYELARLVWHLKKNNVHVFRKENLACMKY